VTRVVRRLGAAGLLVVEAVLLVCVPPALLVAAVVSLLRRSTRPLRSVVLVGCYLGLELATVARIGRGVDDWDDLVRRTLDRGYRILCRVLDLSLILEDGSVEPSQVQSGPGVVVLARHSGPGDSVLIAWLLAVHYRLRLRVVLKAALRWDPMVCAAAPHLPLCFVRAGSSRAREGIRRTASDMTAGDCLMLFPEGGNFSWERRREAIRYLVSHGQADRARRAVRQTHTVPVRTTGATAALQAAPDAPVMLLTHTGMAADGRSRAWWKLPVHRHIQVRTILVPARSIPRDDDGITAFLDQAWTLVDTWVEGHTDLEGLAGLPEAG
jgi:1-acyl-sn-glycerol-3-phosphate acyltransferase